MPLDASGATLGNAIAAAVKALNPPPINPSPTQVAAIAAQNAAVAAQWVAISQVLITYLISNTVVNTADTISNVATVIAPSGGGPCTGAATGTGTGTIS